MASELESDLQDTEDWGSNWLVDLNAGKTLLVLFGWSNSWCYWCENGWVGKIVFEDAELSSKLDWASYIIFVVKTASKKIGSLIRSMYGILAGVSSCYLELLDKLQKRISRTLGLSLATSLKPLAHHWNVASLALFYRYYSGRCSAELAQLVPRLFSHWRYSDRLHDFLSPFLDITRMPLSALSFLAQLDSGILCL